MRAHRFLNLLSIVGSLGYPSELDGKSLWLQISHNISHESWRSQVDTDPEASFLLARLFCAGGCCASDQGTRVYGTVTPESHIYSSLHTL